MSSEDFTDMAHGRSERAYLQDDGDLSAVRFEMHGSHENGASIRVTNGIAERIAESRIAFRRVILFLKALLGLPGGKYPTPSEHKKTGPLELAPLVAYAEEVVARAADPVSAEERAVVELARAKIDERRRRIAEYIP